MRRQPRWKIGVALVAMLLIGWVFLASGKKAAGGITFVARRGNLQISVLEGGSIEALESQEIRSEVKGGNGTKILKIVEEGYQVTEEDVKSEKVLVELDSSDLKTRITQQEIGFQTTLASLTEATQGYDIQLNQNKTDIKAAEQKSKFARMDLEKFMSDKATLEILQHLQLYETENTNTTERLGQNEAQSTVPGSGGGDIPVKIKSEEKAKPSAASPTETPLVIETNKPTPVDYSKYANTELLGDGSAKQQLRKLLDELQMAEQQQGLGKAKFEGTKRLFGKGFVTKTELETEEMTYKNNELKIQTATTARDLFIKYEFPKQAEEFVSKYEEALRGLERVRKEAISKLAQARARFKGAEGRYNIEVAQRKELNEQLGKCVIAAKKTGLVVYGGSNQDGMYYGGYEQIREGATVRERQPIITIPDMKQMSVKVKIHESYIKKVSKGIKAKIQVDAFPEEKLSGEVIKVGVLPDSQNRWMSPDLKVYVTTISIDGSREWVKPGMSAKVEILVKELRDVIHIPLQAVSPKDGKQFCYVAKGGRSEPREIQVGEFNDEFIEIKGGLKEGEKVLLNAPGAGENESKEKSGKPREEEAKPEKISPSPQPSAKKV
ncbi:MAG: efflux RND transporter periplasmic adaptor subunit [Verrucomicrobiota bacterium]